MPPITIKTTPDPIATQKSVRQPEDSDDVSDSLLLGESAGAGVPKDGSFFK